MAQKRSPSQRQNALADALRDTPDDRATSGYRCAIERIRLQMNDETRALLNQRIEEVRARREIIAHGRSGGINASWLARVLTDNGFPVSSLTMQKHIAKRCRCGD